MRTIAQPNHAPIIAEPRPTLGAEVVRLARLAAAVHMGLAAGLDGRVAARTERIRIGTGAGTARRAEMRR
jgi:hypothetical protein